MNALTECTRKQVKSGLFLTLTVVLFSTGCTTDSQQKQNRPESFLDAREVINRVDSLLEKLLAYKIESSSFGDSAAQINASIQKLFEQASDQNLIVELNDYYKPAGRLFSYAISTDKKIAVCSWDSRMGGSMKDFNSIAFYKLEGQPKFSLLDHDELFYNSIHTLTNEQRETIYLFHGSGTSSSVEQYNKLESYLISNDTIAAATVFLNGKSSLTNYGSIGSDEIDFKVEKGGLEILVPEALEFGVVFHPLQFDGTVFRDKIFNGPIDFDFLVLENFYSKNEFKLINGSELPVSHEETNSQDIWVFKDQLTVNLQREDENDETLMKLNANGDQFLFNHDSYLFMKGRVDNYLFFSDQGVPENWPLYIYDISARKIILSISLSEVVITGNRIVYTQLTNADEIENINDIMCDPGIEDQKGYFKVYTLEFSKPTPTVEFANHIFCALVQ